MIADQKVMTCFALFYPTASATAYGQRPKFFMAEHSATAEGENCAYGPTLYVLNATFVTTMLKVIHPIILYGGLSTILFYLLIYIKCQQ